VTDDDNTNRRGRQKNTPLVPFSEIVARAISVPFALHYI
jgi:hypothetical protein